MPRVACLALCLLAGPALAVDWPLAAGDEVIGELINDRLRPGDTLVDMARMHDIGHFEMRAANPGLDPWLESPGTTIVVPQLHVLPEIDHDGIVINLSGRRLYYFPTPGNSGGETIVTTHPVGVGLIDRATPVVETRVTARVEDPAWYPTPGVREWYRRELGEILPPVVPPGPENPLGRHALVLDSDGLLIHGTHRPAGVGMRVSQGCIRLYPESIERLIHQVPVGTRVRIIDQPMRLGWRGDTLYLEIDPAGDEPEDRHPESRWQELRDRITTKAGQRQAEPDLETARAAF
ncbi:MAG: L,D-transpeptidase family protein, partial [Wenzhouxiangellaceae bacterium]